jgi:hypothetical protein
MITKEMTKTQKAYIKATAPGDQALAKVRITKKGPLLETGWHRYMPIAAWLDHKTNQFWIIGVLMRMVGDANIGTLDWQIPFTKNNQPHILKLLSALGWDGKRWPGGNWPPEGSDEEKGLSVILKSVGVSSTMTFPPDETGQNRVLKVAVMSSGGNPYPMSPEFPELPEVPEALTTAFEAPETLAAF